MPHVISQTIQPATSPETAKTVAERLHALANLHERKAQEYGDSYREFGPLAKALFPHGLHLVTSEDFGRFGIISMVLSKMSRYANNFHKGGHEDSLLDICVYIAMLAQLDKEGKVAIEE